MKTLLLLALAILGGFAAMPGHTQSPHVTAYPKLPEIRDKTLVAWVTVANREQRGGSVLTLESNNSFDAIVYGEIKSGAWMAGSDGFRRTQTDQSAYATEGAGRNELICMAAVYQGDTITLYRNNAVIATYRAPNPPLSFASGSTVLIGLRHMARQGQPNSYFAGAVDEARLYDRALTADEIAALKLDALTGPKPLGRWTFDDGTPRDVEGTFPPGVLHGSAYIRGGRLQLNGKDAFMATPAGRAFHSTFHYRPIEGNLADPIPFYWKGEYHVFYLQGEVGRVPWRHIVSRDLVNWRELPTALVSDGAPDSADGGEMFTGSVTESAGTFHIFYTGHNPANPVGTEVLRHATSPDLIQWTKDPTFALRPDGIHYSAKHDCNWRDPYVFWNEAERKWWMAVIGSDPADPTEPGRSVQGLLTSDDLKKWTQQPAIPGGRGEECPDLFHIGDTWYLIGAGRYVSAKSMHGPFASPPHDVIDYAGIYAGKRMFDGKRHVWVGWAWDGPATTDAAVARQDVLTWGGFMCLPRELYPGPDGQLYCKPAREMVALFSKPLSPTPSPKREGEAVPREIALPADCMVECTASMEPGAELTVAVREQADGRSYRLIVRPRKNEIALATPESEWVRSGCRIDASKPVAVRVFLDGSILECFVNDAYAITRRVYDLDAGKLRVSGAGVTVKSLTVKVAPHAIRIERRQAGGQ